MRLRPPPLPPGPAVTTAAVQAAFPHGNRSVALRAECGTLYEDQLGADRSPPQRRPVEVAPWRLARVMVMPSLAGRTDRQAADAVRRCMDWKSALSLERTAPGFDCTLWPDCRGRLRTHAAGQRFRDPFLAACKGRGWVKARGTQRTESPHVLAASRTLPRLAWVHEAMPWALNQRRAVAPAWVHQPGPPAWDTRDDLRSEQARWPKAASQCAGLARQLGADGLQLLEGVFETDGPSGLRRLSALEARSSRKRDVHGVGYPVHRTEPWDADPPALITQGMTTPATPPESGMDPPFHRTGPLAIVAPGPLCATAALWRPTHWSQPRPRTRSR